MKKLLIIGLTLFSINLFSIDIGIKIGYMKGVTDEFKDYSALPVFGINVGTSVAILKLAGEFMYFSSKHKDNSDYKIKDTALNGNLSAKLPGVGVYGGVGIGLHFVKAEYLGFSSDTETKKGLNVFVGYELPTPFVSPYLELRYVNVEDDLSHFMALIGVNLGF